MTKNGKGKLAVLGSYHMFTDDYFELVNNQKCKNLTILGRKL